ncbi:hypothetical protein P3H15_32020 [Rhodococcus sp. T2V]|uniref:hypothetical protein n=1 Tax=Rhodococcus sp. T2V TaxID=3034164 RepID=UPI0023E12FD8|nr:hypothetical protein [Rhodococcus sp. T2V]MDF3309646.1 hypothetical protein [Rhodococcus sp. T2V]
MPGQRIRLEGGPLFAARVIHLGIRGLWTIAVAKKPAEKAALWGALRAYLTDSDHTDLEPE